MATNVNSSLGYVLTDKNAAYYRVDTNIIGPPSGNNALSLAGGFAHLPVQTITVTPSSPIAFTILPTVHTVVVNSVGVDPVPSLALTFPTVVRVGQVIQVTIAVDVTSLSITNGNVDNKFETITAAGETRSWWYDGNIGAPQWRIVSAGGVPTSGAFPPADLNDVFVCVRPGEIVEVDITHADNNQLNIDTATVAVVTNKGPMHGVALAIGGGVLRYTANSGYTGPDFLMFEAEEDGSGGPVLQRRGTLHITVSETKPTTTGNYAHFLYGDGSEIRQYSGDHTTTTLVYTATGGGLIHCMATNRDDSLIYWIEVVGENTIIKAYSYVDNIQMDIANMSTDAVFAYARSLHLDGGSVSNRGDATYHDGVLYVMGGAVSTDGYFRIALLPHVPGALAQTVVDVQYIVLSDAKTRVMGGLQHNRNSGQLVVIANTDSNGTASGTISMVEPTSGVVHSRIPLVAPHVLVDPTITSLVYGAYGELITASKRNGTEDATLIRTNAQNGGGVAYASILPVATPTMSEYIAAPCIVQAHTSYPGTPP